MTDEAVPRITQIEADFDKAKPPTGPPTPMVRTVPEWFRPVHDYLAQVVADESVLLDLCVERAIQIAEFNHNRGLVGIDHFIENSMPPRTQMVAFAIPLAVELYKQALEAVNRDADRFRQLVDAALAKKNGADIQIVTGE